MDEGCTQSKSVAEDIVLWQDPNELRYFSETRRASLPQRLPLLMSSGVTVDGNNVASTTQINSGPTLLRFPYTR